MLKVIAKYLISFLILLLCGYSHQAVYSYQDNTQHFSAKKHIAIEFVSLNEHEQRATLSKKPYSPGTKKLNHDLIVPIFENEEEDKLTHTKKYLNSNNYFITLFSISNPSQHFSLANRQVLYPNTNLSENSHRYIDFGVFRI